MMKQQQEEKVEFVPIDVDVKTKQDFDTPEQWQEYLNSTWPAVIIHNTFVHNILLGQTVARLIEIQECIYEFMGISDEDYTEFEDDFIED